MIGRYTKGGVNMMPFKLNEQQEQMMINTYGPHWRDKLEGRNREQNVVERVKILLCNDVEDKADVTNAAELLGFSYRVDKNEDWTFKVTLYL